jgi:threo-3-hydroxy-L-aspartate ammonia-lyase
MRETMPTYVDVLAAAERLQDIAHYTPVLQSRRFNARVGCNVYFKAEHLQRTGSFKFRGAYNALVQLSASAKKAGVIAFSSGNHAQGVALAAKLLGIPAVICMPTDAPAVKVAATAAYGAEIIHYDRLTQDREHVAKTHAEARGLTLIPPYDHHHIIAGQGTAVLELCAQIPYLDAVLVPVGGGGLIAGSAIAAHAHNPHLHVIGVEPAQAADTYQSLLAQTRVTIPAPDTIADGLRITTPGALTFPIVQQHVSQIITVSEAEISAGTQSVLLTLKQLIEPSAGTGPGALLAGKVPTTLRNVGVILCGGNIEPPVLASILTSPSLW